MSKDQGPDCNPHPDAPHGFNRNASHSLGRYSCDCEGWVPEPQFIVPEKPQPVAQWALIEPQPAQPDCRTCCNWNPCLHTYPEDQNCVNGSKYEARPKVVLWRKS